MGKLKLHRSFPLLLFIIFLSCENEVDLNAPKKDITAAYGVLDGTDSLHFLKINKSFLPEGNAEHYASRQHDRTIYENLSARVRELDTDGSTRRSFELKDTLIDKEAGLFKHDEPQTLYYFTAPDLSADYRYRLQIRIDEGEESEKLVEGESELVGEFELNSHNEGGQFGSDFFFYGGNRYNDNFKFEWSAAENAKKYSLTLKIRYRNIFANGDTVRRAFDWNLGNKFDEDTEMRVDGRAFYETMKSRLSPNPEGLTERKMGSMDLLIEVADEDLYTYTSVSSGNSSSLVQHRPDYTNLDTAAVGIFSSARHRRFEGFSLSDNSLEHLASSGLTGQLKFTE